MNEEYLDAISDGNRAKQEESLEKKQQDVLLARNKKLAANGTIAPTHVEAEVVEQARSDISVQITKEGLRQKALDQIHRELVDRKVDCPRCLGAGVDIDDLKCKKCGGYGKTIQKANDKLLNLVAKPDFPTTSVSVKANIDNMKPQELVALLKSYGRNRK